MDDNKFWLFFWFMAAFAVVSTIALFVYQDHARTRLMLSQGYVLRTIPVNYGTTWAKEQQPNEN